MKDLFSLKGRVALITGGSRGIGKMIARDSLLTARRSIFRPAKQRSATKLRRNCRAMVNAFHLIKDHIVVTAIAPGPFASDMNLNARDHAEQTAARTPAKRIGTPEDMAGAAIFLASRAGDFVAGSTVTVLYLGDHNPHDPLASPLYAKLHGFPPILFHVGADEILLDDSVRVAENAKQLGIETELKIWPVVPHVWQLLHQWIPEGRESLREAHAFLHRHVAPRA